MWDEAPVSEAPEAEPMQEEEPAAVEKPEEPQPVANEEEDNKKPEQTEENSPMEASEKQDEKPKENEVQNQKSPIFRNFSYFTKFSKPKKLLEWLESDVSLKPLKNPPSLCFSSIIGQTLFISSKSKDALRILWKCQFSSMLCFSKRTVGSIRESLFAKQQSLLRVKRNFWTSFWRVFFFSPLSLIPYGESLSGKKEFFTRKRKREDSEEETEQPPPPVQEEAEPEMAPEVGKNPRFERKN